MTQPTTLCHVSFIQKSDIENPTTFLYPKICARNFRCRKLIEMGSGEVCGIARKSVPIHVIVHYPKTEEGWLELMGRVADVHADLVNQTIHKLSCPSNQKVQLLDAVIATASNEKR